MNTYKSWQGQPVTNYVVNPTNFTGASWDFTTFSVSATVNAITAPDGNATADLMVNSGVTTCLFFQTLPTSSVGTGVQTCSIYAKAYTASYFTFNCFYNGDTEVNINFYISRGICDAGGTIEYVGNGWYRCTIQVPARVGAGTSLSYRIWPGGRNLTNTLGFYFWGAQVDQLSYATPFIDGTRSSTQAWIDMVRRNTITVNSLTYSSDNTFSFNGTSNYVSCGNLGNLPSQGTISIWFNSSSVSNYRTIACTQFDGLDAGIRIEQTGAGTVRAYIGDGTNLSSALSFGTIAAGSWHKVDLTWNTAANTVAGYLDGVQGFSTSNSIWPSTIPSLTLGVGYSSAIAYRYFQGNIFQLSVYNTRLTADEVLINYNALRTRFGA
jgi:hypothetical protein